MVVLINENSYSAAEFFAAALQEYHWATLVVAPTSGKGYSQETIKLKDGSALLLSTNEYFTPQGKSLAGVGLTPDVPSASERWNGQPLIRSRDQDKQYADALATLAQMELEEFAEPEEPAA